MLQTPRGGQAGRPLHLRNRPSTDVLTCLIRAVAEVSLFAAYRHVGPWADPAGRQPRWSSPRCCWFQSSFAHPQADTACCRAGRGRESRTSRPRPLYSAGAFHPTNRCHRDFTSANPEAVSSRMSTGKHRLYVPDVLRDGRVSPQSKFAPHPKSPPPEPVLGD